MPLPNWSICTNKIKLTAFDTCAPLECFFFVFKKFFVLFFLKNIYKYQWGKLIVKSFIVVENWDGNISLNLVI